MIAYQTAYMKTYYPTESIVALMVSDEEDIDRIRMEIEEARAKGINILPPDVNESRKHFTFIDNVIQANVKGMFASKEAGNQVYNVACGERIDINYLWDSLRIAADSKLEPEYGPERQGDVRDSLANISKAQDFLGYQPRYTVREGLKITWDAFS